MISANFKLFNKLNLPVPVNEKDSIVLFCENMYDGVGDFDHLKTYLSIIGEQNKQSHYKVKVIVGTHHFNIDKADEPFKTVYQQRNARADYVAKELVKLKENCLIDDYLLLNGENLSNEIRVQQKEIGKYIEHGCAFYTISYKAAFSTLLDKIKQQGYHVVDCPSLASRSRWNDSSVNNVFDSGGIGLPRGEKGKIGLDVCYGLPIQPLLHKSNKILNLLDLKSDTAMGPALLNMMLNNEEQTLERMQEYYESHSIMPGYPQTKVAALNFVILGIIKNLHENKNPNIKLDFFLPKGILDETILKEMLQRININLNIEILTPQSKPGAEATPGVRIFSGFFLDDKHYEALYRARNDICLGSGDNTIIKSLSSDVLPFFQDKIGSIRDFYINQLLHLITTLEKEYKNPNEIEGLRLLNEYIKICAQFVHGGPPEPGLFNVQNEPNGTDENDFQELRKNFEKYLLYIDRLAFLASDPRVQKAWERVALHIQMNHNYRDNFRGILVGSILMNNPKLQMQFDNTELNFQEWYAKVKEGQFLEPNSITLPRTGYKNAGTRIEK